MNVDLQDTQAAKKPQLPDIGCGIDRKERLHTS